MLPPQGNHSSYDQIRTMAQAASPDIRFEDTPAFCSLDVFNRCEETGNILLMSRRDQSIHPSRTCIPLECGVSMPYGLLYPRDPKPQIIEFIQILSRAVH